MIDIETLGNGPTSVILSIGAVAFDPDSNAIGEGFTVLIEIDSCLRAGLTVDGSTIQWWMTQSEEARELFNQLDTRAWPLKIALRNLKEWMEGLSKSPIVWCNHPSFDTAILENAYRRCEIKTPWQYYNIKDYSTVKSMLAKTEFDKIRTYPQVPHDAYHDAVAQALSLQKVFALGRDFYNMHSKMGLV
jgi:hypothetical protein